VSQPDAGICCAVVDIEGVAIQTHRISARENYVMNITATFVLSFCSEDPGIASQQAFVWLLKIE
jgi:lipid-binding SYLF domain-containing protein